jgi:hypothetical protein
MKKIFELRKNGLFWRYLKISELPLLKKMEIGEQFTIVCVEITKQNYRLIPKSKIN